MLIIQGLLKAGRGAEFLFYLLQLPKAKETIYVLQIFKEDMRNVAMWKKFSHLFQPAWT